MTVSDPFQDVLVIQDRLPILHSTVEALPQGEELARINEANEGLLRVYVSLDDASSRVNEELGSEISHELARIETKLNVILEMLGSLLHTQVTSPDPVNMRISAEGLGWVQGERLEPGQMLRMHWHLCPQFPRPLELYGEVASCQALPEGYEISVRFRGLSPLLEEGIQKLVFRRHRRSVAQSRSR
ncbi:MULTISPECIES: PilZ domain-containing protein [Ectothiorhodospira]|jgi:hypothetical protein|uniref:PilZ domain-containing protein n=1 Tax=Ectothiorhodospira marina TaxID=1396821 RepID=A0A1H7MWT2_9GAMM|nr:MULTISPECIES: PilZ domain-containing protein [Ectothiorhodospira]MCG5515014.1 PilZ domain-containing protein [Ectothiorhodospira sp. 9100]MCG5517663.1 PilZ domain-containing protein [Ectothiorhodospira sp. 9905]SEL15155.1 PilZ domain-containing protein [Ectothiorhodospira marina]